MKNIIENEKYGKMIVSLGVNTLSVTATVLNSLYSSKFALGILIPANTCSCCLFVFKAKNCVPC